MTADGPVRPHGFPGLLIAFEGIDRSGRSTHVRRLEVAFAGLGLGVTRTSLTTSAVAADAIRRAKTSGRSDPDAMALLAAADLAERVEQVVLPSLQAGLVVLADRYVWTPMARAESRGMPEAWLEAVFSFAPTPDAVLLLEVDPATSLDRRDREPDPYEAGLDLGLAPDLRQNYELFQARLATCFDGYAARSSFTRIEASAAPDAVWPRIVAAVDAVLAARWPGVRIGEPDLPAGTVSMGARR